MGAGQVVAATTVPYEARAEELTGLAGFVTDVVAALDVVGVGVLVLLENLFPPIPSEVVLPLAGFEAARGSFSVVGAAVSATVGSVVGALVLYAVGAKVGRRRVERWLARLPLMDVEGLERATAWFDDHGDAAVLIGRFVPGVRSLVSLPAGFGRMGLVRFTALTTLGSAVWNGLFVWLGFELGARWREAGEYSDVIGYALLGALVVFVGYQLVQHRRAG